MTPQNQAPITRGPDFQSQLNFFSISPLRSSLTTFLIQILQKIPRRIWLVTGIVQSEKLKLVPWLIWLLNSCVGSNSTLEFCLSDRGLICCKGLSCAQKGCLKRWLFQDYRNSKKKFISRWNSLLMFQVRAERYFYAKSCLSIDVEIKVAAAS